MAVCNTVTVLQKASKGAKQEAGEDAEENSANGDGNDAVVGDGGEQPDSTVVCLLHLSCGKTDMFRFACCAHW